MLLAPGWAAYMRRMLREEIHILDPLCAQVVGAEQMHMVHQEAVSQIHTTLFSCLVAFFAKWRCPSDRWKRRFPKITCDICTSDESGMCMLHAIKLYDGNKMMWPSTKLDLLHALKSYRNIWLLFGKQLLSRSFVWAMSMAIVCVDTRTCHRVSSMSGVMHRSSRRGRSVRQRDTQDSRRTLLQTRNPA